MSEYNETTKDLLEAIQAHPDLPIRFFVDPFYLCDECAFTLHTVHRVEVGKIWEYNDRVWDDEDDLLDAIIDCYWDLEYGASQKRWKDVKDECIDQARAIFEKLPYTECIIVYTSA